MTNEELEVAARDLVRAIYSNPKVDLGGEVAVRQAFRNGYYSVRDLPEFQSLVALLQGHVLDKK